MKVLDEVGRAMLADPACGSRMLGAPIVQGIEKFGDSAITIRMSLRTRQGEQARSRASCGGG